MPDPVSSPEDVLMRMLVNRLDAGERIDQLPFEAVDGLNLVIAPRSETPAAALLLELARHYGKRRFFHAATLGPECRDPEILLWRLLCDLRHQLGLPDSVPADLAAMRETLPNWLARAAAMGGLAIAIQDAHELSRDGLTADFDWLPEWLPQGVSVLISAPPGPAAEQFRERATAVFNLPENSSNDATDWRLPEELLQSEATGRWLELLWISRAGLDIDDLEALTESTATALDPEFPGLLFDGKRIALASAKARDAVARRRLGDHGRRQTLHLQLAEYFSDRGGIASLETACWHWAAAGRPDQVDEKLIDSDLLEAMIQPAHAFEALRHWRASRGSERMQQMLGSACELPEQSSAAILGAAHIYAVGVEKDAPAQWLERAVARAEKEHDRPALIRALQRLSSHGETPTTDAREMLRRALTLVERQDDVDYQLQASVHHGLACLLESEGCNSEARDEYALAVQCVESARGVNAPALIAWLNNLASAHKAAGDLRAANDVLRRSLKLAREHFGSRHPTTAVCCDQLAGIAYMNGQYDSAEPLYREALAITEAAFGSQHPATAACLGNLGSALDARQKFREAEQSHRRSLAILMAVHGENHEDTAGCMHNLAVVLESLGNSAEAERLYRTALETWNEVAGEQSPAFATTLLNLAGVLRDRGAWGEAEALYRSDIELWRELLGADHPHTLGALTELARLYVEGGKPEMAEPLLAHLAERTEAHAGKTGAAYLEVVALLAGVRIHFGERDEARALISETIAASNDTLNMLSAPIQKLRKLLEQIEGDPAETRH